MASYRLRIQRRQRRIQQGRCFLDFTGLPKSRCWQDGAVDAIPGALPVLVTEKDAVKLPATHPDAGRIHVVPLDFQLPAEVLATVCARLPARAGVGR